MKHRWIAALVLALVLALGACAPPGGGQGNEASTSPSAETSATPSMESDAAGDDNPDDYGY